MTKYWIAAVALAVALVLPAAARAHEGHAHKVMGTISAVTDKQIEVKTTDGKAVTIALDAKTVYKHGKAKADVTMLKVGERVVVEAEQPKGATVMTAKTVQMAASATSGEKSPAGSHTH